MSQLTLTKGLVAVDHLGANVEVYVELLPILNTLRYVCISYQNPAAIL